MSNTLSIIIKTLTLGTLVYCATHNLLATAAVATVLAIGMCSFYITTEHQSPHKILHGFAWGSAWGLLGIFLWHDTAVNILILFLSATAASLIVELDSLDKNNKENTP